MFCFVKRVLLIVLIYASTGFEAIYAQAPTSQPTNTQEPTYWLPAEPMPVDFDWIMLVSGEWLKGELISLYNDEIDFDSDELDRLTLDWEDVAVVKTHRAFEVLFTDQSIYVGKLLVKDSRIEVLGDNQTQRDRDTIISIANSQGSFLSVWDGVIALSANLREGNSKQEDFTLRLDAQRRTAKTRFKVAYLSRYAKAGSTQIEDNRRFTTSIDRFLSTRWFVRPLQFEYFADDFQNIDHRLTYTAALGYRLIDSSRTNWDVYIGPGYQETKFITVEAPRSATEETAVSSVGTFYDIEITNDIDFDFQYEAQFVSEAAGKLNHHGELGFSIDLLGDLDLDIRYIIDVVEEPVADAEGNIPDKKDTSLNVGISYEF